MRKDQEAIDSLRFTRSKWKEIEKLANVKLDFELKPLHKPKTFLDVDYGEEDDDIDYQPEENPDEEPDEPVNFLNFV